ncbi:methyltransferase domain-containing protein [Croceicoccus sp. F390]|uniref:Methyltransferase domain-containing protein n=1 Tax=Croceicoccus esteveae TaxID=3075597 RepID=A0ABU2ZFY6_9SPHN|nr:methyltransferase domain-containing protein [Croceicoccus sp. F390]MDT0575517.1 methyltransferase domain-containing protein [Croceicoccus sp. F390]
MAAASASLRRFAAIVALASATALLTACEIREAGTDRPASARAFPEPDRPVSQIGSNRFSTERARDERSEAAIVMEMADIRPGMTVADIGAGEGYYTVRLAERVGSSGRVLAQDIDSDTVDQLGQRVERERLDNVSIKLGRPDDPGLPAESFDRIFLVHMYHEVAEPYAFLWRLHPALKAGGQIIVVDADRQSDAHGIAPKLLFCEFQAVGFRLAAFNRRPDIAGYYARFESAGNRPEPDEIKACRQDIAGSRMRNNMAEATMPSAGKDVPS